MATLSTTSIPQYLNKTFGGAARTALQALFSRVNVDLLAVEARALLLEPAVINCTASTLTVTAALHAQRTVTLNRAAGIDVTLPAATGTGNVYRFIVGTTFTSSGTIKVVGDDTMVGHAIFESDNASDACIAFKASGTDDTITFYTGASNTTGGVAGAIVTLTDIAADLWHVSYISSAGGTEVTPFSATVS